MDYSVRKAKSEDLPRIEAIYAYARKFMAETGNPNQWRNNHPPVSQLKEDIEKELSINDEIDKLRHSATCSLFERRDVIIVASVSCIYGLGDPIDYNELVISLRPGMERDRDEILKKLVEIQYERNDINFVRNKFRVRGDTVEIYPAYSYENAIRVEFFGDEIDRMVSFDRVSQRTVAAADRISLTPAAELVLTAEVKNNIIS